MVRSHYGQIVATLTRILGPQHLDLVEDVVQDAMVQAARLWSYQGVPERPVAWLVQVARNKALDAVRQQALLRSKAPEIDAWAGRHRAASEQPSVEAIRDDTLRMMFVACHPALAEESRVALTLKAVGGFGTGEIARAFLTTEPTVAQRIVRAKAKLRDLGLEFDLPVGAEFDARLASVLRVLYLVFSEGYAPRAGDEPIRHDLVREAVRLARELTESTETARPEVHALLALMYLLGARIPSRISPVGELVTLEHQDRARWNQEWLALGATHFAASMQGEQITRYHVEAAIASVHAMAPSPEATDWPLILRYYDQLRLVHPSPIVELNRAVAFAMVHGPDQGLALVESLGLDARLQGYFPWAITRAELMRRLEHPETAGAFGEALALATNPADRKFVEAKMESLGPSLPDPL